MHTFEVYILPTVFSNKRQHTHRYCYSIVDKHQFTPRFHATCIPNKKHVHVDPSLHTHLIAETHLDQRVPNRLQVRDAPQSAVDNCTVTSAGGTSRGGDEGWGWGTHSMLAMLTIIIRSLTAWKCLSRQRGTTPRVPPPARATFNNSLQLVEVSPAFTSNQRCLVRWAGWPPHAHTRHDPGLDRVVDDHRSGNYPDRRDGPGDRPPVDQGGLQYLQDGATAGLFLVIEPTQRDLVADFARCRFCGDAVVPFCGVLSFLTC